MGAKDALDALDAMAAMAAITAAGNACWTPIRMMARPDCEYRREMQSRWLTVIELGCLNSTTGRCYSPNYLPSSQTDELTSYRAVELSVVQCGSVEEQTGVVWATNA